MVLLVLVHALAGFVKYQQVGVFEQGAGKQAQASGAAIALQDGTGVSITNSRAMPGTKTFLQMDKVEGRRVFVNYDLSGAAQVIMPAGQRFDTQIGGAKAIVAKPRATPAKK